MLLASSEKARTRSQSVNYQ